MSKGKFEHAGSHKRRNSKPLALLLACTLLVGCLVGGTVAWLTATDDAVTNTFSVSDIGVELEETTTEYKMIPGWDIAKDPKAWVTEGSEDALLFVKVEESENFDDFMTYAIATGWNPLGETDADGKAVNGVYYREITSTQMGKANAASILAGDKVTVKDDVTKEDMEADDFTAPTLTFTAYAHQLWETNKPTDMTDTDAVDAAKFDPADAWANLNPSTGN